MTKTIINKDPMPPKSTAPFDCNIYHKSDKINGYEKRRPYGWKYHNKRSQMEIFRLYEKGRKYLSSSNEIWVDSVKYSLDRNKSYDDNSVKLSNVFEK